MHLRYKHSKRRSVCIAFVADSITITRATANPETCRRHVLGKIMRGREVRKSKSAILVELEASRKTEKAHLEMQQARVEYLKKQVALEGAVSTRIRTQLGECCATRDQERSEADMKERLGEAGAVEQKLCENVRDKDAEISLVRSSIQSLDRVLTTWEAKFDQVVEALLRYISREDLTEGEAMKLAGLKCRCEDVLCDFPFTVDANHAHL